MPLYQTWNRHGWVKRVELVDPVTGRRGVGRDWESWETAHHKALEDLLGKLTRRLEDEAARLCREPHGG